MQVKNILFTSGDGIHWILEEGFTWNTRGAEPGAGCFYCEVTETTFSQRPVIRAYAGSTLPEPATGNGILLIRTRPAGRRSG